jgi:general secretion pathway protein L
LSFGGPLPRGMTVADTAPLPEAPDPLLARFDLRSGTAATDGRRLPRGVVPALAILAVFLGGHLLVAAADLVALDRIASARADQLRTVLAAMGEPVDDNLNDSLSRALAARDAPARPDFLDLATRVFGTLADQSGTMSLRDLHYEAGQDLLIMTVEAGTLEALQGVENALLADGLVVQTGAATTGDGAAEVQMTVGRGAT